MKNTNHADWIHSLQCNYVQAWVCQFSAVSRSELVSRSKKKRGVLLKKGLEMETLRGLEDGGGSGLGGGDLWLRESAMEEEEEEDSHWQATSKVEKKEEVEEVEEEDVPGPEGRSGQERLAPEEEAAFQSWVNGECKILTTWKLIKVPGKKL